MRSEEKNSLVNAPKVDSSELARAFRAALVDPTGSKLPAGPLQKALSALVASGRAAWPDLPVDELAFVEHLARRVPPSQVRSLAALQAADLYLAFACISGQGPAVLEVLRRIGEHVRRQAARLQIPRAVAEEAEQALAASLAGGGEEAGLGSYTGVGPLDAWLRSAALRVLLRHQDRSRREVRAEVSQGSEGLGDLELEFIKGRYRPHFADAFREALSTLSDRERTVLRLHLTAGMNIEAIGLSYRVHRATVARWIAAAREKLLQQTHRSLAARLSMSPSEAPSLARLLKSQLEVSLSDLLPKPDKGK